MRPVALRVLLSAACLIGGTLAVSSASAQEKLMANVPFPFRAGTAMASSGNYEITANFTPGVTALHNMDTKSWVSVLRQGSVSGRQDGRPRLVFRCTSGGCALCQIFMGSDGWQLPTPRLSPAEKERLAVIYLDSAKRAD